MGLLRADDRLTSTLQLKGRGSNVEFPEFFSPPQNLFGAGFYFILKNGYSPIMENFSAEH